MTMMKQNFFRCGLIGWCLEVFWTGLHALRVRDSKLTGTSSLWMFPIYGCAAFLRPIMEHLKDRPVLKRGCIYMVLIFLGEYISGSLLKRKNACPWDYSKSPFQMNGVIRLDFAPVWFLVGLLYERLLTK
jgi:uncharacterized membrane protein